MVARIRNRQKQKKNVKIVDSAETSETFVLLSDNNIKTIERNRVEIREKPDRSRPFLKKLCITDCQYQRHITNIQFRRKNIYIHIHARVISSLATDSHKTEREMLFPTEISPAKPSVDSVSARPLRNALEQKKKKVEKNKKAQKMRVA